MRIVLLLTSFTLACGASFGAEEDGAGGAGATTTSDGGSTMAAGGSMAASGGNQGSGGGTAGGSSPAGGGGAGAGGTGGQGGSTGLDDTDLFARYWLDAMASGVASGTLADTAPNPQALSIDSSNGDLTWVEPAAGRRGLVFADGADSGRPFAAVETTKFSQLWGRDTLTIEIVASSAANPTNYARLLHLGDNGSWSSLQLATVVAGELQLGGFGDQAWHSWDLVQNQRHVIHFVLETQHSDAEARTRLYLGGVLQSPTTVTSLPQGTTIEAEDGPGDDEFIIGNVPGRDRSWNGTIFYVAVYTAVLSDVRIAEHASVLVQRDDP